jgi:MFS family permease
MQQVGAASLMAEMTRSPMMVALVQTAASLPSVLLGLPAGALADMVERRRWLIFTQTWLLGVGLLATLSVGLGELSPWGLLALTMLMGIGFALHAPASQSVIGEVVPTPEVPAALGLGSVGFNVSRIAGPALAGALIGLAGGTAVYVAAALCSVLVLIIVTRWEGLRRPSSTLPPERLLSALRSGVRFVRHTPVCVKSLSHTFVFMGCGSGTWALLPVLARDVYALGTGGYGWLLGAFGAGGVLGVFSMRRLRRGRAPNALVALSALAFGLVTGLLAVPVPFWAAMVVLVVGGIAWTTGATTIYATLQLALPDWVRARGVSIYNLVYFLAMAGGAALWGALASALGLRPVLAVVGIAMMLAALWQRSASLGFGSPTRLSEQEHDSSGLSCFEGMQASEDEPVLVQHIYRVRPEETSRFLGAANAAGRAVRRNGARFWRLYRDLKDPGTFIERYMVDSLGDLQRQHQRMTPADREHRRRLAESSEPGCEPVVLHFAVQGLPPGDDEQLPQ